MLILPGSLALSAFRQHRLLRDLSTLLPAVRKVEARYLHLVDGELTGEKERQRLEALLQYGDEFRGTAEGELFLVVPRPGTISPWSSKATDIARNCGLAAIRRIERATAFHVGGGPFTSGQRALLAARLHDRMTQSVLASLEAAAVLFRVEAPRPLSAVDILGGRSRRAGAGEPGAGLRPF